MSKRLTGARKTDLHIPFTRVFNAVHWFFEEHLSLLTTTKVSSLKMEHSAVNAFVNGMWQLFFRLTPSFNVILNICWPYFPVSFFVLRFLNKVLFNDNVLQILFNTGNPCYSLVWYLRFVSELWAKLVIFEHFPCLSLILLRRQINGKTMYPCKLCF